MYLLDIEDSPLGVSRGLILRGVSDKTFFISEGDIRRSDTVTLVVGDDFDFSVLHHTDAGVCGSQINTNNCSLDK